ncbi:MAG: hypothetical protein JHC98_09695 [Thermoleophilaceae bacterium]|nr:hypothetical protein [Thermoleophilaceae bacterium]
MAEGRVVGGPPAEIKTGRMRAETFGMFIIGMLMWVGVPGVWLYIGSQIKASSDSLGLALVVMGIGALATVVVLVKVLGSLNRSWLESYEELNDRRPLRSPLEPILVISAGLALATFGIWFAFFAGGGGPTVGQQ